VLEFSIVLAARQNEFFVEIAEAIVDELVRAGHPATISRTGFEPQRKGLVNVILPPHEYYTLEGLFTEPQMSTLRRTVFICAEQPGSSFFEDDAFLARRAGAVLDINRSAVREFERRGVKGVRHFPLGWTPTWSRADFTADDPAATPQDRAIDVLHLGIFSPHRAEAISAAGNSLQGLRSRLILGDDHRVNSTPAENFAMREEKWRLLRNSRVLLNIHVADRPYFEWLRVVQAICCGCAVVSEHSTGYEPLVAGRHFLSAGPHALGLVARALAQDEDRRHEIAQAAWLLLHDRQPFSASVATLIEAGHEADGNPVASGPPTQFPQSNVRPIEQELDVRETDSKELSALKDIRLEMLEMRRRLDRLTATVADGRPPAIVESVAESRSFAAARPRVSVITALYNYEHHIVAALDSAAASTFEDLELIVVDDGSRDRSCEVAQAWLAAHEDVPAQLVRHPINRGLGPARNTALDYARGELVFVLDADNVLYRRCIADLVDALDSDPGATFAYGMLEMFDGQGPVGLRSAFPWLPERFVAENFVDAMALIRADWLRDHGGYTTDTRLYGWEDYDLWCGVAQAGGHGVFIPSVVARYRASRHSMLGITDISSFTARSVLAERHPDVFAEPEPSRS
jgi:hypothetical protein